MGLCYLCNAGHEHADREGATRCNERPELTHYAIGVRPACGRGRWLTGVRSVVTCRGCKRARAYVRGNAETLREGGL